MDFKTSLSLECVQGRTSFASPVPHHEQQITQVTPALHKEDYIQMLEHLFKKWDALNRFTGEVFDPFRYRPVTEEEITREVNARQRSAASAPFNDLKRTVGEPLLAANKYQKQYGTF